MPDDDRPDPFALLARVARERRGSLAAVARKEGLGAEDALDCVHDALCTFLQHALEGDLPADPGAHEAWLVSAVIHAARNKRRRHHLARPHDDAEELGLALSAPSAEAIATHVEECARLRACVDRLCKSQRSVVLMRLLEERSGEDVAAALGLTRGHVDVLLHRARVSLRVCMRGDDGDRD